VKLGSSVFVVAVIADIVRHVTLARISRTFWAFSEKKNVTLSWQFKK